MTAPYRFGCCELRPAERPLLIDGKTAALGARAFDLLLALIERRERTVGKSELLDLVWPGLVVEENNLQVQVSALRKPLGPNAIATTPGARNRQDARLAGGRARFCAGPRLLARIEDGRRSPSSSERSAPMRRCADARR